MTRFADVAAASVAATATRSRLAKVAAFVELFGRLAPDEVVPVVAWLSGDIRQGRIGVGWATVAGLDVDAAVEPVLDVGEVDATFAELAVITGPGSVGARNHLLRVLFSRATPPEIGLLRGLIQGGIRQGALESLVGDAVAKATGIPGATVRRAAMLAGDLPSVARLAVTDGEAAVAAIGLSVGRAVQPMLAASAATVAEALELTGEASVEWKLDGARIQVHRDGDEVHLYTRNLNEITDRLPTIVDVVRSFPAQQLVLDGEAIGIDAESERPDRFQETMSRFGSHTAGGGSMLVGRFFDVLHRDGEDLMDRPLSERLAILDEVCGVTAMPRLVTSDPEAAAAFADEAIALGHEGVMVKAIDSTYDAGRRGGSWRKVKPVRTFDLVVLAVEWGSGRRRGWLSNLHLGARAVDPDDGFVMVGKTFKGMTDELLTWQTEQLLAREVSRDGHVVHVRPELVVEIALDGVQASTRYPGGLALRFARVRGYRDDKDPGDADLITSLQALL